MCQIPCLFCCFLQAGELQALLVFRLVSSSLRPALLRGGCEHPCSLAGQRDPPPRIAPLCDAGSIQSPAVQRQGRQGPGEQSQPFVWPIKLVLTWLLGRARTAMGAAGRAGGSAEGLGCTWGRGLGYRKAEHKKETFEADGVQRSNGLTLVNVRGVHRYRGCPGCNPWFYRCCVSKRVSVHQLPREVSCPVPAEPSRRPRRCPCASAALQQHRPSLPQGERTWTRSLACEFVCRLFPPSRVFCLIPGCQRCAAGERRAGSCLALCLPFPSITLAASARPRHAGNAKQPPARGPGGGGCCL